MTDILLAAVNSRYSHTNIAVRILSKYTVQHWDDLKSEREKSDLLKCPNIDFFEWTINQKFETILFEIYKFHPRIVLFSIYIWNVEICLKLVRELHKILPKCIIGVGGPEVGYRAADIFKNHSEVDVIFSGEGERSMLSFTKKFAVFNDIKITEKLSDSNKLELFLETLQNIPGVNVKSRITGHCVYGPPAVLLSNLSDIPFPYSNFPEPDNRIYYYESSRGCPFSCIYCMSSIDKTVRFMPLERVKSDLEKFLKAKVKLVKFVDRTFNLKPSHYIAIWKYICLHHNKYTMFHFEIAAEQFTEEALNFLQTVPKGVMQFEIGIQSTNTKTLQAVRRPADLYKIHKIIDRIPSSINVHLDLIAGLPYEDISSYHNSFDFTIGLYPDMLQMGFLKVLYGTDMKIFGLTNGWKWMSFPPYEVLETPYLSFNDISFLKKIEILLDIFYNSGNFKTVMNYIIKHYSVFDFLSSLVKLCEVENLFFAPPKVIFWYDFLNKYVHNFSDYYIFHELIRFDFISLSKKSGFPVWCEHFYEKEIHKQALSKYTEFRSSRESYATSEYDTFSINPFTFNKEFCRILFLYEGKHGSAKQTIFL